MLQTQKQNYRDILVNAEVDPAALLSIYASRISDSAMGRQLVSDYQIALSYALRDRNPKYVVRYVIGLNKVITIQYLDMARKVFGFF